MFDTPYHSSSLSDKSFLVTGGAGFIGSNIVEYLLKFGAKKVRVLDNFATGKAENIKAFEGNPALEVIDGDIRSFDDCVKACAGIDYVSHQAALGSVPRSIKDPATSNAANIDGFVNMVIAARDAGVKKFVYASSSSVYGDEASLPKVEDRIGKPLSPYAVTKLANELYAEVFQRIYPIKIIGLRYFNIFGPRQDPNAQYSAVIPLFVKGVLTGGKVFIDGDGEQTRDFTFVENAVQANVLSMLTTNEQADNTVYNIASAKNFSVNQIYGAIRDILQKKHTPEYRESRLGDIRNSLADISKAEKLLGYKPTYDFETGLRLTVQYFVKGNAL